MALSAASVVLPLGSAHAQVEADPTVATAAAGEVDGPCGGPAIEGTREELARRLFMSGVEAWDHARLADARCFFEASLSALPNSATALNLTQTLMGIGLLRAAELRVEALIQGAYGAATELVQESAAALREELRGAIPIMHVQIVGAGDATIAVDMEPSIRVVAEQVASIRLDPGAHTVVAITGDGRRAELSVSLARGQERSLRIDLSTAASPPDSGGEVIADTQPRGGDELGWLIGVAVAIVTVGVAVGIGVAIAETPPSVEIVDDPVWGHPEALIRF